MMINKIKYHQVWKEILKIINSGNGEINCMKKLDYLIMIYL